MSMASSIGRDHSWKYQVDWKKMSPFSVTSQQIISAVTVEKSINALCDMVFAKRAFTPFVCHLLTYPIVTPGRATSSSIMQNVLYS